MLLGYPKEYCLNIVWSISRVLYIYYHFHIVIPRETEGYGVELVRLSVRPSVRLSVCLSVRPP